MLFVAHGFFFIVFVATVLVFLLATRKSVRLAPYRDGVILGLLLSPLGIVGPYLLFGLIVLLCQGTWPFDGIPLVDGIARVLVPSILLFAPCICPALVVLITARRKKKNA
jgi:hypothetical protein